MNNFSKWDKIFTRGFCVAVVIVLLLGSTARWAGVDNIFIIILIVIIAVVIMKLINRLDKMNDPKR